MNTCGPFPQNNIMKRILPTLILGLLSLPVAAAPGLIGEYFKLEDKLGDEFEVPVGLKPWLVRIDKTVDFAQSKDEFHGAKLAENFMVRWSGAITVPKAGSYLFALNSKDGSRFHVGDKLVVDNWGPHPMKQQSGTVRLRAGSHPVRIIYQNGSPGAGCVVKWMSPGGKLEAVPASVLFHDADKLKGIKWDQQAFAKAARPNAPPAKPVSGSLPQKYGNFVSTALRVGKDSKGDNIAFRARVIRLDPQGAACVAFDSDTMRMAAGWTGGGLKLEGLPFTGGHGAFPSHNGAKVFSNQAAPGWADTQGSIAETRMPEDGKYPPLGPLPKAQAHYKGLYVHGDKTVLRYTVGPDPVLELPALENGLITRTIQGKFSRSAVVVLADEKGAPEIQVVGSKAKPGTVDGRIVLKIPAGMAHFKVVYGTGQVPETLEDLTLYMKGGPARWTETVTTTGQLAKDDGKASYVLDRLTVPYQNPYGMKMRIGGFDFFSDPSRAAVCTWDGDVWIVSGIDEKLEELTWKRVGAGGHETLGLTVVDDMIYTVADDQITRYHDLNGDGETDYYENFNNDWELTSGFHAFCFDLQIGPQGEFYFAFGSPVRGGGRSFQRMSRHHGSILRVSKDGSKLDRYATGLRAPNGIGVSPTGQITSGDNEGTFVPRCPLHWIEPGEFLGVVDSAADFASMKTTPTVGQRRGNRKQHLDPSEAPLPLAWLPKNVDNSNGGQVWITSDKWGPYKGEMLHFSYGQSSIYIVLKEKKGDLMQGGVVKIPVRPTSSAMRGKFNRKDGQLYVAGLKGWQSNAGREGGLDRVRYTGRMVNMPSSLKVRDGGIEIGFTRKLDKELAEDPESFNLSGSDLRWTHDYGTGEFQVGHRGSAGPPKGRTRFPVKSAKLLPDGKSVFVEVENLQPVHMMQIDLDLETDDGEEIVTRIWNTIHVTQ